MDSEICKNCGSKEIYGREVRVPGGAMDMLPIGFFSERKLEMHVCANCGLVEWFVPRRLLDKVRAEFPLLKQKL